MTQPHADSAAVAWQIGIWNRISDIYLREIDDRFAPVVDAVVARARLQKSESVLDLGVGTGAVAAKAAARVGPMGKVMGLDISPDMLAVATQQMATHGLTNVELLEGRAERIPAEGNSFDVVLSSLSFMYVIDRAAAAREVARVLRPGGRFVAAVWGGAGTCDIVLFQQTAGQFAGTPPVAGVGPGALADPTPFLQQLRDAGITAQVDTEVLGFAFPDFSSAWTALAGVTTAHLPPDEQERAQEAVRKIMYPDPDAPRQFGNLTQFVTGELT